MESHEDGDAAGAYRVRLVKACSPCHRSKIGCDKNRPCGRCVERGKVDECVDHVGKKRGRRTQASIDAVANAQPFYLQFQLQLYQTIMSEIQFYITSNQRLPNIDYVAFLLAKWRGVLSQVQIDLLVDFLANFGNASYRKECERLRTVRTIKRLELGELNPTNEFYRKNHHSGKLLLPSTLEFLPLPVFYTCCDLPNYVCYSYMNRLALEMLEIRPEEFRHRNQHSPLLSQLSQSKEQSFYLHMTRHILLGDSHETVSELESVRSRQRYRTMMNISVEQYPNGSSSVLMVLVPTNSMPKSVDSIVELDSEAAEDELYHSESMSKYPLPLLPPGSIPGSSPGSAPTRLTTLNPFPDYRPQRIDPPQQPIRQAVHDSSHVYYLPSTTASYLPPHTIDSRAPRSHPNLGSKPVHVVEDRLYHDIASNQRTNASFAPYSSSSSYSSFSSSSSSSPLLRYHASHGEPSPQQPQDRATHSSVSAQVNVPSQQHMEPLAKRFKFNDYPAHVETEMSMLIQCSNSDSSAVLSPHTSSESSSESGPFVDTFVPYILSELETASFLDL
eukprot:GILK01007317.1.p1 GENE.GILK01007317.1~~GILK01007317.1.p1  ORF type:complete len:571 (+),score=87.11 GILK01007317.1:40-1713(+)